MLFEIDSDSAHYFGLFFTFLFKLLLTNDDKYDILIA